MLPISMEYWITIYEWPKVQCVVGRAQFNEGGSAFLITLTVVKGGVFFMNTLFS